MSLNGNQIAAKIKNLRSADGDPPCDSAMAWLYENGDKPFGWLWAQSLSRPSRFDWLASALMTKGALSEDVERLVRTTMTHCFARETGWGTSLAVLRALESL